MQSRRAGLWHTVFTVCLYEKTILAFFAPFFYNVEKTARGVAVVSDMELRRLEDMEADVAFFPVDGRLGASKAEGAKEFCAATQVRALVTMHNVGYPQFEVPEDFFAPGRAIPVWSPTLPGETRKLVFLDKEGEFR